MKPITQTQKNRIGNERIPELFRRERDIYLMERLELPPSYVIYIRKLEERHRRAVYSREMNLLKALDRLYQNTFEWAVEKLDKTISEIIDEIEKTEYPEDKFLK